MLLALPVSLFGRFVTVGRWTGGVALGRIRVRWPLSDPESGEAT
jgi:hypothetical protein